ncbi:MAG: hypothetical protein AAGJ80_02385 [Cyanobacteria bacterium J06553_1]
MKFPFFKVLHHQRLRPDGNGDSFTVSGDSFDVKFPLRKVHIADPQNMMNFRGIKTVVHPEPIPLLWRRLVRRPGSEVTLLLIIDLGLHPGMGLRVLARDAHFAFSQGDTTNLERELQILGVDHPAVNERLNSLDLLLTQWFVRSSEGNR